MASGFDKIGQKGRLEFRMVTEDQQMTDELRISIADDLIAYRDDHSTGDKPMSISRLAELSSVAASTVSDILNKKFRDGYDPALRKIDQFLADDRERFGRLDIRSTAKLSFTEEVQATFRAAIRLGTMPVIIGSPGVGKTQQGRAFAASRQGVYLMRANEASADARGVSRMLCENIEPLRQWYLYKHAERVREIKVWLRKHLSTFIIIDEAQKLDRSGLEMLRDFHDESDPAGRRNVPIAFMGDQNFLKLIFDARSNQRSVISSQCIRRMRPVLNIDKDCVNPDGGLYTTEDVIQIVRNSRVKLLTPRACRWIRDLANVIEYGALGNAMGVLQLAVDLATPAGGELSGPIDIDTLQEALAMTFGKSIAVAINEAAEGALLKKVG